MTHRSGGKGTYLLDRIFPGVGRVKRASGTKDRNVFKALNGMLSQLWAAGRTDVLAGIRDGNLHPLEVWGQTRTGTVHDIPTPEALEAFDLDWTDTLECTEEYRRDLKNRCKRFVGTRLADLPGALAEYRDECADMGPMFNRTKAALQGYLNRRFGQHHHLWMNLSNVRSLPEDPEHGNPQTVEQLTALTARMDESCRRIAWSMALTGMGPKEYWGKWRVVTGVVEIGGTKTKGRVRRVPLLGDIYRPYRTRDQFKVAIRNASDGAVTPYDMRRSWAVWMELAGVTWTHIRLYLGHRAQSVTDRYLWREVMQHIPADGKKVRAWLAEQRKGLRLA